MPEQTGQDSGKTIDLVVKATAIALSVLYIFGYFVVSLRLAEFGIHSVALLRIQYLAAGFFSLGPLFLIYFLSVLAHSGFEKLFVGELRLGSPPASAWKRIGWTCVALLRIGWGLLQILIIAGFVIDGTASIFVPEVHKDLLWHHPWIFARLIRDSTLIVLGVLWVPRAISLLKKEERGLNLKTASQVGLPLVFSAFFVLAYTKQFSHDVYPEIPFAIGGGKPESVVFLLKRTTGLDSPPVVRDKTKDRSIPYKLILETDNSYAVISQGSDERAIQFNREAVDGYVVMRETNEGRTQP